MIFSERRSRRLRAAAARSACRPGAARKNPRHPVLAAGTYLLALAAAAAAHAEARLGPATPLMTDQQRAMLGIQFGPDAEIDVFCGRDGQFYLNTTAAMANVKGPGKQETIDLHVDPAVTQLLALHGNAPASGPQDVQQVFTDRAAQCGWGAHRKANDAACQAQFDRDYAGGGVTFRCPDGALLYFYHGENHTAPDGSKYAQGGWFGIGLGIFNRDETRITRIPADNGQIAGLDLPASRALAPGAAPQQHPFNGVPSLTLGTDGYLYLITGNASRNPEYAPASCTPECMSLSRAPAQAVCDAAEGKGHVTWKYYYHGAYTEPALLDDGAGGHFTPILAAPERGEHGGSVTWLPALRRYAMVHIRDGGILLRMSSDELHWSAPQTLLDAPAATPLGDAATIVYPRIIVTHAGGAEAYVLTYVVATKGHFWKWAELMRAPVYFSP